MKEKLAKFFEQELVYTRVGLLNETDPDQRTAIYWDAVQRGWGAAQFAQVCGMRFLDVAPMFEQFKEALEVLCDEVR